MSLLAAPTAQETGAQLVQLRLSNRFLLQAARSLVFQGDATPGGPVPPSTCPHSALSWFLAGGDRSCQDKVMEWRVCCPPWPQPPGRGTIRVPAFSPRVRQSGFEGQQGPATAPRGQGHSASDRAGRAPPAPAGEGQCERTEGPRQLICVSGRGQGCGSIDVSDYSKIITIDPAKAGILAFIFECRYT